VHVIDDQRGAHEARLAEQEHGRRD
jgi:hypothetical protein